MPTRPISRRAICRPFNRVSPNKAWRFVRTDPAHLEPANSPDHGKEQASRGKAPDGNTVAMEEQLGKVADTASTQELVTNLYHKYQGMFRMVLGRSG